MSTKTSIKRIAAVAAVALTLGGFTAVTAHAAATPLAAGNTIVYAWTGDGLASGSTSVSAFNAPYGLSTGVGVAGAVNTVQVQVAAHAGDLTAGTSTDSGLGHRAIVTVSGAGATISASTKDSDGTAYGTVNALGTQVVYPATNVLSDLTISTPTAGTVTVNVYQEGASGIFGATAAETVTWTINATATSGVLAVGKTTAYIHATASNGTYTAPGTVNGAAGTAASVAADDVIVAAKGTAQVGVIKVSTFDALGGTYATKIAVSVSGAGLVAVATAGGDSIGSPAPAKAAATGTAAAVNYVYVYGDNTAGTGTITVTAGTNTLTTKTVTFYGTAATIKATQQLSIASKSGAALGVTDSSTATTFGPAATLVITDAAGLPVSKATITAVSSDLTVIASGTCAEDIVNTPGTYYCSVTSAANSSGKSATVTWTTPGANSTTVSSAAQTYTLGGSVSTVTAALDAASYAPGSPLVLSFTAKDSSGNPVFDGARANFLATGGLSYNYGTGSDTTSTKVTFVGGVATRKGYAPLASGNVVVSGTYGADAGTTLATTTFSVTAAVAGSSDSAANAAVDAANEATDAANAATDAANNAMDSADAAQQAALDAGDKADAALAAVTDLATKVSAIASQIAALSALVKKIAAKVKA